MERVAKEWDGQISIHAPVKGATRLDKQALKLSEISIHAPVKGATKAGVLQNRLSFIFQSTPP